MNNRVVSISMVSGIMLLTFVAAAFMVPALFFLAGLPLLKLSFWLAAALAVVIAWLASRMLAEQRIWVVFSTSVGLCVLLLGCSLIVCGYFYDLSYDGQAYHQEAILYLAEGWNPVYDQEVSRPTGNSMWINHYAKAAEIAAAAIYKATGLLEHSKAINLIAMAASGLLSLAALLTLMPKNRAAAWVAAPLLAFNPVSMYQSLTFYVDGLLGSLLLCLIALGCLIYKRPGWLLLSVYTMAMILTMNIKFTAIGYAGVLTIGLLIALYMSEQFIRLKQLFRVAALGGMIGVLIVGYNPYVTNTLHDGHPFYPLAGEDAIDVVKSFTPRNLERMNRFEMAAASYFAKPMGNDTAKKPTEFQWPFMFDIKKLPTFAETDVAVSGFGPLFSGALILSLLALVSAFRKRPGVSLAAVGVIAVLAGSSFINPAAWWARYVPQLWAVPIICALLALSLKGHRLLNGIGIALVVVLAANSLLVGGSFTITQLAMSNELRGQLAQLQSVSQPVKAEFTYSWSNRERLKAFGIEFKEESPLSCSSEKVTLIRSGTTVCIDSLQAYAK